MAEGVHVIDAGMVGTEMLYWLVGSRELDGGLMCTASHNPKAYTGAKLVKKGAIALSGDAGIQDIRRDDRGRACRRRRAAAPASSVDIWSKFQNAALAFIDPAVVKPLKVVVDGGNGMAGPMVGPLLRAPEARSRRDVLHAGRQLPRPRAEPAAAREPPVHHGQGRRGGRGPRDRLGRRRRPLLLHRRHGRVRRRRLPDRAARRVAAGEGARQSTILYDVRASWGVPRTVERLGGRALPNRVGHAFFKTRMREEDAVFGGEVSGHYYFRDFYCADSGTIPALLMLELLSTSGKRLSELLEPYRSTYFISGEINSDGRRRRGARWRRSPRSYAAQGAEIGHLDGVSVDFEDWHFNVRPSNTEPLLRLCLESLVSARGHGAPARRGPRADPLVTGEPAPPRSRAETAASARDAAVAQGIHCIPIPTPFAVGRVNVYLLEDDPLTLLDAGRNSGRALDELEQGARRARAPGRGPRADPRQPPAHGPRRARRTSSPAAPAPRSRRSTCSPRGSRATASSRTPTTRSPAPSWPATASPTRRASRCGRCRTPSAAGARRRR